MSKIYVNQTNITISLITSLVLENVDTALIKFKRPDNTEGQWTATTSGQLVEYSPSTNDINMAGIWTLWVYITFTNTKISIGEPTTITIYEEGK